MRYAGGWSAASQSCWIKILGWTIMLKGPASPPLYSETYGYRVPRIKLRGYRLFVYRSTPDAMA